MSIDPAEYSLPQLVPGKWVRCSDVILTDTHRVKAIVRTMTRCTSRHKLHANDNLCFDREEMVWIRRKVA